MFIFEFSINNILFYGLLLCIFWIRNVWGHIYSVLKASKGLRSICWSSQIDTLLHNKINNTRVYRRTFEYMIMISIVVFQYKYKDRLTNWYNQNIVTQSFTNNSGQCFSQFSLLRKLFFLCNLMVFTFT